MVRWEELKVEENFFIEDFEKEFRDDIFEQN